MGGQVFRVKLDLPAIQAQLSADDQCARTAEQVRKFLLDSDFVPDGEWWVVDESDLGAVTPAEVIAAEVVGDSPPHARAAVMPTLGELREYEEELDWRESRRRARSRPPSLLGVLLVAATSFVAGVRLRRKESHAPIRRPE